MFKTTYRQHEVDVDERVGRFQVRQQTRLAVAVFLLLFLYFAQFQQERLPQRTAPLAA